jgi:RNA polymerase sigma-70 factor (ECF subfamily)
VENDPGEITRLLFELKQGNRHAEEMLIALVYKELRRIAAGHLRREKAGHTLQPTALVHEAYLRLTQMQEIDWQGRAQFFAIASTIMRRVLVDYARAQKAKKRGEGWHLVSFNEAVFFSPERPADILALDDALNELATIRPRIADTVQMLYFAGMTEDEVGTVQAISTRTVKRDMRFAKAWLRNGPKTAVELPHL